MSQDQSPSLWQSRTGVLWEKGGFLRRPVPSELELRFDNRSVWHISLVGDAFLSGERRH